MADEKEKIWKNKKVLSILIGVVIVVFLGFYFYNLNPDNFEFAGLDWKKIDNNGTDVYYSKFMIMTGFPVFNAVFQTDPRENDVEIDEGVFFKFYPDTFISLKPDIDCEDTNDANLLLRSFFNSANIKTKVFDNYTNCMEIEDDESLIIFEKSDYPFIWQPTKNCYVLRVGNCESVKTAEKFIGATILQYSDIEKMMEDK